MNGQKQEPKLQQESPVLRCLHHPAAPLNGGECRACIRLGYAGEIRAHKVGRGYAHTIHFATDAVIDTREPCCGEDLGTHAEWCTAGEDSHA